MYDVITSQSDASYPFFIDSKLSLEAIPSITFNTASLLAFSKFFLKGCWRSINEAIQKPEKKINTK